MKRRSLKIIVLVLALFVVLFFGKNAAANLLLSGTSGTIAGTSLQYTDLTFTRNIASVRIRNNGRAIEFSSRIRIVDVNGRIMMQTANAIKGIIPASGVTHFSDTYPRINYRPQKGVIYQVQWVDMAVKPLEEKGTSASSASRQAPPSPIQYSRASEIQNIINRYLDERPLTHIMQELGPTEVREGSTITWFNEKNGLYIIMDRDSRANTARIAYCYERFTETLQREKRYAQIVAEFERLLASPPTKRQRDRVSWDLWGGGWLFSITQAGGGDYKINYSFSGPR